jgi:titin
VISGNGQNGVYITSTTYEPNLSVDNAIIGNYIGVASDGLTGIGNGLDGVTIRVAKGNRIGGVLENERNVISGNPRSGVALMVTGGNTVHGNYIGTDATGTVAVANLVAGVSLTTDANSMVKDNLISGNNAFGIQIAGGGAGSRNASITGNSIGMAADSETALGNGTGIAIAGRGGHLVDNVTIGGAAAAAGNLISGNRENGVVVDGLGATNVVLEGNLIGTTSGGSAASGNLGNGVELDNASGVQVVDNVVSGNGNYGIAVLNGAGNLIERNLIGTDATGTVDFGNGSSGVLLTDTTGNTLRDNVISGNEVNGVFVVGSTSATDMTNLIESNFIGTNATGTHDLGNALMGVRMFRGTGLQVRDNVLSGNNNSNILVDKSGSGVLVRNQAKLDY